MEESRLSNYNINKITDKFELKIALEEEDEESKVGRNSDEIEINESDLDSVISWVNTIMEET